MASYASHEHRRKRRKHRWELSSARTRPASDFIVASSSPARHKAITRRGFYLHATVYVSSGRNSFEIRVEFFNCTTDRAKPTPFFFHETIFLLFLSFFYLFFLFSFFFFFCFQNILVETQNAETFIRSIAWSCVLYRETAVKMTRSFNRK